MFDDVGSLYAVESGAARIVLSQRTRAGGNSGLSLEFYGRQADNRWVEALRLDIYPMEVHYHWFKPDQTYGEVELPGETGNEPTETALSFIDQACRPILHDSGFYPGDFRGYLDRALADVRAHLEDQRANAPESDAPA